MNSRTPPSSLRTFLILGRASNLPTVWSNCFAGWLIGGGGEFPRLVWLSIGATFLYVGGMFLNDAFDANFDRQHRRQRPIPTGAISERKVWICGFILLISGFLSLVWMGKTTAVLALLLIICIVLYDAIHKAISISPILMAGCRFFLYLVAASATADGVNGLAIWSAFALAFYIVGLSYLARRESSRSAIESWPCYFLTAPILLALLANSGEHQRPAFLISFALAIWILWSLRHTFWKPQSNIGFTVSQLLAGITVVDWLAVDTTDPLTSAIFAGLFFAALLFQRFIPAT